MASILDDLDDQDFIDFKETDYVSQSQPGPCRKPAKVDPSKKSQTWIAPSFDGFDIPKSCINSDRGNPPTKKQASGGRKRPRDICESDFQSQTQTQDFLPTTSSAASQLWAEKYTPKTQAELGVHKKKVQEVQAWLSDSLAGRLKKTPFLLLSGPAGAGKTATIGVLAHEMGLEIQEWINPVQNEPQGAWNDDRPFEFSNVGSVRSVSQNQLFRDFLLRSNKYAALNIFSNHSVQTKVILVEDFPNVFFRDPSSFHETLRSYRVKGHCPLVFIVSDSQGSESTERLLFPKDLQAELGVANISFNPVAVTSLTKTLTRIATQEASCNRQHVAVPDKSTIEALANSSAGDIRGAINSLQFACLKVKVPAKSAHPKLQSAKSKTSTKLTSKQKSKSKTATSSEESVVAVGARDTSLFLFRALGKILYCKRDKESDTEVKLPDHLSHHQRAPLIEVPEDIVEKAHMSGEVFTAFLHQNYLDFFSDVDDVVMATEYLSDVDYLTIDWSSRSTLGEYAASVAARALMFCNSRRASGDKVSGPGWKPLHKPEVFAITRKARDQALTSRHLFTAQRQTPEELHTQVLPYLSRINVRLSTPAQIVHVQNLARFPVHRYGSRYTERLDEKEVSEIDTAEDVPSMDVPQSGTNEQDEITCKEEDEDVIIEDFDD